MHTHAHAPHACTQDAQEGGTLGIDVPRPGGPAAGPAETAPAGRAECGPAFHRRPSSACAKPATAPTSRTLGDSQAVHARVPHEEGGTVGGAGQHPRGSRHSQGSSTETVLPARGKALEGDAGSLSSCMSPGTTQNNPPSSPLLLPPQPPSAAAAHQHTGSSRPTLATPHAQPCQPCRAGPPSTPPGPATVPPTHELQDSSRVCHQRQHAPSLSRPLPQHGPATSHRYDAHPSGRGARDQGRAGQFKVVHYPRRHTKRRHARAAEAGPAPQGQQQHQQHHQQHHQQGPRTNGQQQGQQQQQGLQQGRHSPGQTSVHGSAVADDEAGQPSQPCDLSAAPGLCSKGCVVASPQGGELGRFAGGWHGLSVCAPLLGRSGLGPSACTS